jgi:hypothetical protein
MTIKGKHFNSHILTGILVLSLIIFEIVSIDFDRFEFFDVFVLAVLFCMLIVDIKGYITYDNPTKLN